MGMACRAIPPTAAYVPYRVVLVVMRGCEASPFGMVGYVTRRSLVRDCRKAIPKANKYMRTARFSDDAPNAAQAVVPKRNNYLDRFSPRYARSMFETIAAFSARLSASWIKARNLRRPLTFVWTAWRKAAHRGSYPYASRRLASRVGRAGRPVWRRRASLIRAISGAHRA